MSKQLQLSILVCFNLILICSSTIFAAGKLCSEKLVINARTGFEAENVVKQCSPNPVLYHAVGLKFIQEGNNQEALPWIKKAFLMSPNNADFQEDYIVLLVWLGKYKQALSLFQKIPKNFPRRPYLLRNVAFAAVKTNNLKLASQLYTETLKVSPYDKEAFTGLCEIFLRERKFKDMERLLKVYSNTKYSSVFHLTYWRFCMLLAQNRPLEAFRVWHEAQDYNCNCYFDKWRHYLENIDASAANEISGKLFKLNAKPYDVFFPLAISRQYNKALEQLINNNMKKVLWNSWPLDYLPWLAWTFYKTGDEQKAEKIYRYILKKRPNNKEALVGLVYCFTRQKAFLNAESILGKLQKKFPNDLDVLFAQAFFYESQGRYLVAIEIYDKIRSLYPANTWAIKSLIDAYSKLGIPSYAIKLAKQAKLPSYTKTKLELDEAAFFQRWGLAKEVESTYKKISTRDPNYSRAQLDYLLDLRQQNRYPEILHRCKRLVKSWDSLPFWAKLPCADTYLYYDRPEDALKIYDEVLKERPNHFNASLGRFYSLVALRKWKEANKLGNRLLSKEPPGQMIGKKFYPNWKKVAAAIAIGYLKAETRPLSEAQNYFLDLKSKAPAHSGIGASLGDVYLWRGWPRKALQELKIAANKDPKEKDARVSIAYALDELGYVKDARNLNALLLKKFPFNKHVINQKRYFHAHDMRQFVLDFSNGNEDADSTSYNLRSELNEQPFSGWRIYQYFLWQYSSFGKRSGSFQRLGMGLRHRFNQYLFWEQEFSFGIEGDKNLGIGTAISWMPDDYWNLSIRYDSYSTETPLRARAAGIDSDEVSMGVTYRFSEWRAITLKTDFMNFSDNNERLSGSLTLKQGLLKKGDWLSEILLDNYLSFNSKDPKKVDYWNPRADWSCSLTHMLQYTQWRSFDASIVHRLFLSGGSYYQRDYGTKFIASGTYEFDRQVSLRTNFSVRVGLARRIYDGDVTTSLDFSFHFSFRF